VLLVEDNDDARMLLTTILTRSSAIVSAAENVPAAMRILETTRPDLVVSDIEMPGEDGYSFIRRLRQKDSPLNRVPAIALTAYTRGVDRVRALAAGFQMHLGKPIDPAELVAAIKSLVTTSARG
jgi:CheY-like chemotaxis protein